MGIDCSHFTGKRWNVGARTGPRRSLDAYVQHGVFIQSGALRLRLIEEGIKKQECETCGCREWMGRPVPLELDHLNSDHFDNRLENLSVVCPNCHAQVTADRLAMKKLQKFGQYVMF